MNVFPVLGSGSVVIILSPFLFVAERDVREQLELLLKQGITRLQLDSGFTRIEDILKEDNLPVPGSQIPVVIDRVKVQLDEDSLARYADSVQTAFSLGKGECHLQLMQDDRVCVFSDSFEMDGMKFDEPDVHMFSFNNPIGACPLCEGYGKIIGIDEDLVIPNKSLSIYEDAIVCWKGEKMSRWKEKLLLIY